MLISQILAAMHGSGGRWHAQVPDSWAQGRTVFGGLQAALALRAMRSAVPDVPVRTLQVTFIAPVAPGAVTVEVQVLRRGKSATQVEARIVDGDQVCALAVGVFGVARPSAVQVTLPPPVVPQAAAQLSPAPYLAGIMPAFLQHAEMRWARGAYPYSGSTDTRAQIYARLSGETRSDEYSVLALADAIPPLALGFLKQPAAGSSMTWAMDFLSHDFGAADGHWLLDAELSAARNGYLSQTLTLWNPQLQPVALSRQAMVIFA